MLTGDNVATAKQISEELALNEYYAQLLPQNKVEILEEILKNKTTIK